jgi:hypothetical protein
MPAPVPLQWHVEVVADDAPAELELEATGPTFDPQTLLARNGSALDVAAEMLQAATARQLQTTVTMSDNTNTASAKLTSSAFHMSPSDFSAIVFQQPALSYKVYSPTTLKVGAAAV